MTSTGISNYQKFSTGWIEPLSDSLSNESEHRIYLRPFISKFFGVPVVPQISLDEKIWSLLNQESKSQFLKEKKIQLVHITPQTFIQVLHFIRRDPFMLTKENLQSTWEAASNLQIKNLQTFCLQWVKKQLELLEKKKSEQKQEMEVWIRWFPHLFTEGYKHFCQNFIVKHLNQCMNNFDLFSKAVDLFKTLPIEKLEGLKWPLAYQKFLYKFFEISSIKFLKIPFQIKGKDLMALLQIYYLVELHLLDCRGLKPKHLLNFRGNINSSIKKISLSKLSPYFQTQIGQDVLKNLPLKALMWTDHTGLQGPLYEYFQNRKLWKPLNDESLNILQNLPLETLHLYNWKNLTSDAYFKFQSLTHLKKIIFEGCHLNNAALAVLSMLDHLKELHFLNVPFSNEGLEVIGQMNFLNHLQISDNDNIDLSGLPLLSGLHSLRTLGLDRCFQIKVNADTLSVLSQFKALSNLSLKGYVIDLIAFQNFLKRMPHLKQINLSARSKKKIPIVSLQTKGKKVSIEAQTIFYRPEFAQQPGLYIKVICKEMACSNRTKKWAYIGNNRDFYDIQELQSSAKCTYCKKTSISIRKVALNQCFFNLIYKKSAGQDVSLDLSQMNRTYIIGSRQIKALCVNLNDKSTMYLSPFLKGVLNLMNMDPLFFDLSTFIKNMRDIKKYNIFVP